MDDALTATVVDGVRRLSKDLEEDLLRDDVPEDVRAVLQNQLGVNATFLVAFDG
jgi:hypothetical protein